MKLIKRTLREHWQAVAVMAILSVILTWPTLAYSFRADALWLPTGERLDVFIKIWDVWYGRLMLSGQADRFFTDAMFYPEGTSLASHTFGMPHVFITNALWLFMPLPGALNLSWLLLMLSTAVCAYLFALYLFKDKWLALFCSIVMSFNAYVHAHIGYPDFMTLGPLPLCLYFLLRGFREDRLTLVALAGIVAGITSELNLYLMVCMLMTIALGLLLLAPMRWREKRYWIAIALLMATIAFASVWRLYPLLGDSQTLAGVVDWAGDREREHDLLSYIANFDNSITGPVFQAIFGLPKRGTVNGALYLGIVPLALASFGLWRSQTRKAALPWLLIALLFFGLSLGSILIVGGVRHPGFPLPKQLANRILPALFESFYDLDHFMSGLVLPLAVLATYGLKALRARLPLAKGPLIVLLLSCIVAFETHVPVVEMVIKPEEYAFLEWLESEEESEIRLINAPMGRMDAKRYNLYQALSGYPNVEGAISRTPDSAFDYIYASPILGEWRSDRPVICGFDNEDLYRGEIAKLAADGFSHVVFHRHQRDAGQIAESFYAADAAYSDDYVSIYRLSDLDEGCPSVFIARQMTEANAVQTFLQPSALRERHGLILGFQADLPADERQLRMLSRATFDQKPVVSIVSGADGSLRIDSSQEILRDRDAISQLHDALWLVNNPQTTDLEALDSFVNWFSGIYRFCQRALEAASGTIDLYVKHGIPCEAAPLAETRILYNNGIRLLSHRVDADADQLSVVLAWRQPLDEPYSFSIQVIGEDGEKALQVDNIIQQRALVALAIQHGLPPGRTYSVELIVYDYATGQSVGGAIPEQDLRFERALEIARITL